MEKITVNASKVYDVTIGAGILENISALSACTQGTAVLVTDTRVAPLHLGTVEAKLRKSGCNVKTFVVPEGEIAKSFTWYEKLLSFLAQERVTRSDTIFALGGGVVGDLSGFTAASYLRGINYIQLPTTLLAAVDSSVGGKTAINLPEGKNLVGSFYQPGAVIMDTNLLATLDDEVFTDGCAEIIKYAVLVDSELFTLLQENVLTKSRNNTQLLEKIIARCVAIKRDIVALDERDTGVRNLLNLGHTLGHAIEKCADFKIRHGHAVASGMAMVSRVAAKHGICPAETPHQIESILKAYNLPTGTDFAPQDLFEALRSDKKINGDLIRLILPEKIGTCRIETIRVDELYAYLME